MTKNMGSIDRGIRIAAAVLVAALYFSGVISGTVAIVLGVIAAVFILTSAVGFCPVYPLLRLNTCGKHSQEQTPG